MSNKKTTLQMVAVGAIFLFLGANPALAKTIFVDDDCMGVKDGTPGKPFCTIQEAVDDPETDPGDTIDIAAGTYMENVFIDKSITLLGKAGVASDGTIVDGGGEGIVITVMPPAAATVTLSNLTITGGSSVQGGAGIANVNQNVRLTLINSTVTGNMASGGGGGGILNFSVGAESSFTLINSTVSGNTFSGTAADGFGGGGILNFLGIVRLFNTTVAENTDDSGGGGGILNFLGQTVELTNSIIADNLVGYDCGGDLVSMGHNLDSDASCLLSAPGPGDLPMVDPFLGPLADNGGPTETHALLVGSLAIDAGDPLGCDDPWDGLLTTDQRGKPRPETAGGMCDIGAFEVQPEAAPLDHFLSYQIRPSKHARDHEDHGDDHVRPHQRRFVSLKDQFGERTLRVVKPAALLNPADKNDEGINDPDTHLMSYKVEGRRNHRPRVKNILVDNQFGELFVDLVKADRLLVPASKSRDEEPAHPPDLANINVDHFLCYRVRTSRGTPRFPRGTQVSVADQLSEVAEVAKVFDVKGPTRLCTPVYKDGEGIQNPYAHLMCYSVKRAKGEPRHQRMEGIWVKDQFGAKQVDTHREEELCLPSETTPSDGADEPEHAGNHHVDRDDDHDDDDDKGKGKGKGKDKDKDSDGADEPEHAGNHHVDRDNDDNDDDDDDDDDDDNEDDGKGKGKDKDKD